MIDAIVVGRSQPLVEPREPVLIGLGGNANSHIGAGLGLNNHPNASIGNGAASNTPCPQLTAAPCPQFSTSPGPPPTAAPCPNHPAAQNGTSVPQHPSQFTNTGSQPITYSNTVAQIVQSNCLRCHGGAIRNLSTYDNLKAYADNGLLMMMIQPGGPMSRFLSADDAHKIISWVKAGSPP
jgi:mono/diheme cytochrome c family protein